ncbi:hypothetical protein LTR50_004188 [Elasticomyces elasticus]|nr:hypothetical protein LTR50_004188 [Elasticomyces elasticus]
MICPRCLFRASTRRKPPILRTTSAQTPITHPRRPFSHTGSRPAQDVSTNTATTATGRAAPPSSSRNPPAATSTSAAQPFSTPLVPSPDFSLDQTDLPGPSSKTKSEVTVRSTVPAGTVLKGLNFIKGKQDPVAMEDKEYPDWLWGILEHAGKSGEKDAKGGDGDLYSKSKKQRRVAAKKLRKQALLHPESLVPKIPLYEQSVDLPAGDGSVIGAMQAGKVRAELTKAMRDKRRSVIKEDNFLRAMR